MPQNPPDSTSVLKSAPLVKPRKVKDVPFVELFGGRVQGVVSSGSDINRVYVSFFEAAGGGASCSTNNNRPCGGGGICKHLQKLLEEAVLQFGAERVGRYLAIPGDPSQLKTSHDILGQLRGGGRAGRAEAGVVFSRFLNYLRFVELEGSQEPMPEMSWFISG
jgi:hypothetical protein